MIRIYDAASNLIETHQHAGDFKEWRTIMFGMSVQNEKPPRGEA